jgi:NADH-ubiquinone oxidoreductase chain 1
MISAALYLVTLVIVLIAVSFYTLYERKILSLAHIRKGPLIVGVWGILQPFADAVKLFSKGFLILSPANYIIFLLAPLLMIVLSMLSWSVLPLVFTLFRLKMLIIFIFVIVRARVFSHLGSGWGSNSNYALVGALRCVAQRVRYEIRMVFLFISPIILCDSIDLLEFRRLQERSWVLFIIPPLIMVWWISSIAETNRRPFDFAERERELVSN